MEDTAADTGAPDLTTSGTGDAVEATTKPTPAADAKPTETVEFWKQKAREQETRAKANAAAAKRLGEIEEANKSELDKANERAVAAEKATSEAVAAATRFRVAAKFGISDEHADLYLTGLDEETLRKQAEGLSSLASDQKKKGNVVPKEGAAPPVSGPTDERTFVRDLFGNGAG